MEAPDREPLTTVIAYLASRQLLLLLDKCEHLIGVCAELTQALLRACPLERSSSA
jgi:non-specific serine/threonine protein kinase